VSAHIAFARIAQRVLDALAVGASTSHNPDTVRLGLERLEDRTTPADFVVDTLADTSDANFGDGQAKDAQNKTSLRACIDEGNALAAAGKDSDIRITFSKDLPQFSRIALQAALPPLLAEYTITGPGPGQDASGIVIGRGPFLGPQDDGPPPPEHIFRIFDVAQSHSLDIQLVTIADGYAAGAGDAGSGGGIRNQGVLIVNFCSIVNNQADGRGGGIASVSGKLQIYHSEVSLNTAGGGGGISAMGDIVQVVGCRVSGNQAVGTASEYVGGGGLLLMLPGALVSNSDITCNTSALYGGGIAAMAGFTMTGGSLDGNRAAAYGGGVWAYTDAACTVSKAAITSNWTENGKGGGVYVVRGTFTLDSLTAFSDNWCANRSYSAWDGGGYWSAWATVTMINPPNPSQVPVADP
jgi:hypothetical protein